MPGTGASAVPPKGLRFGKGHGLLDLGWGRFTDIGAADAASPVMALVHGVQVIDEPMTPGPTGISVDRACTPARRIATGRGARPGGVKWDPLTEMQTAATPPLAELRAGLAARAVTLGRHVGRARRPDSRFRRSAGRR